MENYRPGPRVILEAKFLMNEHKDARHLKALEKMGSVLVMIDMLSYELCTPALQDTWLSAQRKLMQCPAAIECWLHATEMLENEATSNLPTLLPVDNHAT